MKDANGRWEIQTPHKLFDYLREMYSIKSDKELAHILGTRCPMISRVRNGAVRMTPALILAVHDQTKLPVDKIREMCK